MSLVALVMPPPSFFGDRLRGQILVARADVVSISRLRHLKYTQLLILLGLNLSDMLEAAGVG